MWVTEDVESTTVDKVPLRCSIGSSVWVLMPFKSQISWRRVVTRWSEVFIKLAYAMSCIPKLVDFNSRLHPAEGATNLLGYV
jgi:hypothetical protein